MTHVHDWTEDFCTADHLTGWARCDKCEDRFRVDELDEHWVCEACNDEIRQIQLCEEETTRRMPRPEDERKPMPVFEARDLTTGKLVRGGGVSFMSKSGFTLMMGADERGNPKFWKVDPRTVVQL